MRFEASSPEEEKSKFLEATLDKAADNVRAATGKLRGAYKYVRHQGDWRSDEIKMIGEGGEKELIDLLRKSHQENGGWESVFDFSLVDYVKSNGDSINNTIYVGDTEIARRYRSKTFGGDTTVGMNDDNRNVSGQEFSDFERKLKDRISSLSTGDSEEAQKMRVLYNTAEKEIKQKIIE